MQEERALKDLYTKLYDGMVNKDQAKLDEALAPSFVLIHMTGMRQSKDEFIDAVLDGTLNYFSADHQAIKTQVHNTEAQLIGESLVNAAVFGGGRHTWRLRLSMQSSCKKDVWRFTEAQASTY